jgi:ABC-2 type transport system permease protein
MSPKRVTALAAAQFKEYRRDFGAVFLSLIFPLFFVVILVSTNLAQSAMRIDFALVDPQQQNAGLRLADALASENVQIKSMDAQTARKALADGRVKAVVTMPADAGGEIGLEAGPMFASFASLALDAARVRLLPPDLAAASNTHPYRLTTVEQGPDAEFTFIFPGILALALLQLGLFSTATPLLRARERGTLRYLLLTPLSLTELLTSQLAVRLGIALVQILVLLGAGSLVTVLSVWQWALVLMVSLLGIAMLIAVGYAVAGIASSLETGLAIIMILNFAMMFGGNIFWNPESATALWIIAHLMPVSYLADLFRQIIVHAPGLWPAWFDVAALVGWTVLALLLAIRTFRFDMDRRETRRAAFA